MQQGGQPRVARQRARAALVCPQAVHRRRYSDFRASVAKAIATESALRNRSVDADALAVMFIALSDGVWLEQAIDPTMLSPAAAREACFGLLEAYLGPLPRSALPTH